MDIMTVADGTGPENISCGTEGVDLTGDNHDHADIVETAGV